MPNTKAPPVDPFDDLLGYHLRRASALAMADLCAALAKFELRPAEASILWIVAVNPQITQSRIGRMLGIRRANMVPLVAGLTRRGYLSSTPVDGRSSGLQLTTSGKAVARKSRNAADKHDQKLFGALSAQDRRRWIAELRALWEQGDH